MAEQFVRQRISVPVDTVVLFRELVANRDGGFWLDDSLGDTVSYLGVGVPMETIDPFAELDGTGILPVSRVGWVGYGERESTLGVSVGTDPTPRAGILRVDLAIEIDHRDNEVSVIGIARNAEFDDLVARVNALAGVTPPEITAPPVRTAHWRDTPADYGRAIERCLGHIRDGDAYQLCLTTGVDVHGEIDLADTYVALRSIAPTRNASFVRIGRTALLSASPETFMTVRDRRVTTSPIKGTRRRSDDAGEDLLLKRELENSEKEQAENLMIVDLCRNDLSIVCDPSSVTVTSLNRIETYSTVHQLVSTVTGELLPDFSAGDAARALFPAGSMTGAPKRRAVTILEHLETAERGMYSGVVGYSGGGNVTLAMTIRSIVVDDSGAHIGVGGGITSGSVVDDEIAEVGIKAAALLSVLGASPNPYLFTE